MHCPPDRLTGYRTIVAAVAALAVGLTACSMHPLPEDVTAVSTYDIVEKIRCEVKDGLRAALERNHPKGEIDKIVKKTVIGYDFSFEISEDNNATKGKLKYERAGFRKESKTIWELTGSSTRTRKNKRDFRIIERLMELNEEVCWEGARANWVYPITGSIGLDEVIRTYVDLELLTRFRQDNSKKFNGKLPVVFSEELTFTTEFGGGIQPTLELATIAGKFRLTNATIFGEAKRKDIHSVTVALAQDGVIDPMARQFMMMDSRGIAAALAQSGTRATAGVLGVLDELERRRRIREDERVNTRLLEALRLTP
jgi:hypothetical protein